jgi:hypothetical protein
VGPPPPGATRELGVLAMLLLHSFYTAVESLSTLLFTDTLTSTRRWS